MPAFARIFQREFRKINPVRLPVPFQVINRRAGAAADVENSQAWVRARTQAYSQGFFDLGEDNRPPPDEPPVGVLDIEHHLVIEWAHRLFIVGPRRGVTSHIAPPLVLTNLTA